MAAFSLFSGPEIVKASGPSRADANLAIQLFRPDNTFGAWANGNQYNEVQQWQGWLRTAISTKARLVGSVPQVAIVRHETERKKYLRRCASHEREMRLLEKSASNGGHIWIPRSRQPEYRQWASRYDLERCRVVTKDLKPQDELEYMPQDDRISRLFTNPNGPFTGEAFWRFFCTFYFLHGESYIWVLRDDDGLPIEMYVIPPAWVEIRSNREGNDWHYMVRSPNRGQQIRFEKDDLIRLYNPSVHHPGMADSPVMAMAKQIDIYTAIEEAQFSELRNRPYTAGHFTADASKMPPGTDIDGLKAMLDMLQQAYFGYHNSGRVPPLPPGVNWEENGSSHEVGFQNSRDAARAAILAHCGLDEAALGYSNEATYAAAAVTDARILRQLVAPEQRLIAAWLGETILREFSEQAGVEYRAVFANTSQEDPQEKRANVIAIKEDLSVNERRQAMGYEPFEHEMADVPTGMMPFVADEDEYPNATDISPFDEEEDNASPKKPKRDEAEEDTALENKPGKTKSIESSSEPSLFSEVESDRLAEDSDSVVV